MRNFLAFLVIAATNHFAFSQKVGVNTNNPLRMLSVNGSLMVDQQNANFGTLDSAALLFGTGGAGIFSNKNVAALNLAGIDFWTNNQRRMIISSGGSVGINLGIALPSFTLDVNGTIRSRSNLRSDVDIIATDDAIVGGDAQVTGNGSFGGNLTVTGVATVGGKGIVRSNSATQLRMGFSSGAFGITLNPSQVVDITFNITPFNGDNDNIRVAISQFVPDANSGDSWGKIVMTVHSVNAAANQCQIRFYNPAASASTMVGRLYLMSVATD